MHALVVAALAGVLAGPPTLPPEPVAPLDVASPDAPATAELRGRVAASGFELDLGRVTIELDAPTLTQPQRLRVDLRGEFVFVGLTPGRYVARARYGDRVVELPVELRAGVEARVELLFSPPTLLPPAVLAPPPPAAPALPPRPAGAIHDHPESEGAGLRRFGLAATVTGVILGIGGVIAGFHNPCGRDGANGSNCDVDVRNTVALVMGVTGFGLLSGGITSMAIGRSLERRARLEAGLAVHLDPRGGDLGLRLRF